MPRRARVEVDANNAICLAPDGFHGGLFTDRFGTASGTYEADCKQAVVNDRPGISVFSFVCFGTQERGFSTVPEKIVPKVGVLHFGRQSSTPKRRGK